MIVNLYEKPLVLHRYLGIAFIEVDANSRFIPGEVNLTYRFDDRLPETRAAVNRRMIEDHFAGKSELPQPERIEL